MAVPPFKPKTCTLKEFVAVIDEYLRLKPLKKQFEKAEAKLKAELDGMKTAKIGPYEYSAIQKSGAGYVVQPYTYWEKTFTRKDGKANGQGSNPGS